MAALFASLLLQVVYCSPAVIRVTTQSVSLRGSCVLWSYAVR